MLYSPVTDLDECEEKKDNCDNVATCINTPGSFSCQCPAGYYDVTGEGSMCKGNCDTITRWFIDYMISSLINRATLW